MLAAVYTKQMDAKISHLKNLVLVNAYTKNPDTISRFDREADLLKNYRIEGLPQVEQGGYFPIEFPNNPIPAHCLVMEKIPGLNLEQWLKQHGAIDKRRAIDWLKQLTTILERLHSNNFIHRDIKPSNIMYRNSDNRIFLIDLGAVRLIRVCGKKLLKSTGLLINDFT